VFHLLQSFRDRQFDSEYSILVDGGCDLGGINIVSSRKLVDSTEFFASLFIPLLRLLLSMHLNLNISISTNPTFYSHYRLQQAILTSIDNSVSQYRLPQQTDQYRPRIPLQVKLFIIADIYLKFLAYHYIHLNQPQANQNTKLLASLTRPSCLPNI